MQKKRRKLHPFPILFGSVFSNSYLRTQKTSTHPLREYENSSCAVVYKTSYYSSRSPPLHPTQRQSEGSEEERGISSPRIYLSILLYEYASQRVSRTNKKRKQDDVPHLIPNCSIYSFRCRRSMLLSTCFLRGKQKCKRSHKIALEEKTSQSFFFRWHLLRLKTFPIPSDDAYRGFFFFLPRPLCRASFAHGP